MIAVSAVLDIVILVVVASYTITSESDVQSTLYFVHTFVYVCVCVYVCMYVCVMCMCVWCYTLPAKTQRYATDDPFCVRPLLPHRTIVRKTGQ